MFRDSNINGIQLFSLDDASLLNMGVKVWSALYLDVDRTIELNQRCVNESHSFLSMLNINYNYSFTWSYKDDAHRVQILKHIALLKDKLEVTLLDSICTMCLSSFSVCVCIFKSMFVTRSGMVNNSHLYLFSLPPISERTGSGPNSPERKRKCHNGLHDHHLQNIHFIHGTLNELNPL